MVKAAVRYTGEHFRAAAEAAPDYRQKRKNAVKAMIIWAAFTGLMLTLTIMRYRSRDNEMAFVYGILFVINLFYFLRIVSAVTNTSSLYSRIKPAEQIRYFEVEGDELLMTIDGDIEHSERHFRISGMYSAADTGEYFVIYLYKSLYCMIGYSDITDGTSDELRSILYNALGNKFAINQAY
jgi:hypothetical protein